MEMKIAVIGAGVSGLSVARMLQDRKHSVTVYERENEIGGLVRCRNVAGALFHQTGGHVFNTKYPEVEKWFWALFDRDKEFVKAIRNSALVLLKGIVPYPIENYIYMLEPELQKKIISEILEISYAQKEKKIKIENFEDFLCKRFGPTLYEIYFKPYNRKIWKRDLSNVPIDWLEGKLPMPTAEEIIYNNFNHVQERSFVHSTFYYPLNGGSGFIVNRLSEGLDIKTSCDISEINRESGKWVINGEKYDAVVFCGNIKQLPSMLSGVNCLPLQLSHDICNLEAHGTTTVFCNIDENDYSWIYLPDSSYDAHRIICTGNFSKNNNNGSMTATVEFTDEVSYEDIISNLKNIPFSPKYICHNYAEYTYPIQNKETRALIDNVKNILEKDGFYLLGRFAEWEYYNMDVAINAALGLCNKISS